MKNPRRVETDVLERYAINAARQYTRERLAAAIGKPTLFMGKLQNVFPALQALRFNHYYPEVIQIDTRVPMWVDEADSKSGREPTQYITQSTTTRISLTNGKTRVAVSGAVIVYVLSCIAASTWEPNVSMEQWDEFRRIGSMLLEKEFYSITEEDTWGL